MKFSKMVTFFKATVFPLIFFGGYEIQIGTLGHFSMATATHYIGDFILFIRLVAWVTPISITTPQQINMAMGKSPFFNRIYIFIHGRFFPLSC